MSRAIITSDIPGQSIDGTLIKAAPDSALVGLTDTQTMTNKTITGAISTDIKRCSTATTAVTSTTLVDITGLTGFSLVAAGVYEFDVVLHCTATVNGGVNVAFKYTTATLTSLQSKATGLAAASLVNAAQTTTATDQALLFTSKAAAFLQVNVRGTLVVNAAGTLAVQMAQETSHADTTTVLVGSTARFTRIA